MAKSDRLFRLLSAFRLLPQPLTAARLAEEMGVSERTLYRDIDSLRAGGALIDGEAGVGYTLTEDPALPPQMFTQLEVEALVLGLAEVRQAGDPALAKAAEVALAKITATLPERIQRQALHAVSQTYRYEPRPPAPPHLGLIRACCWEERMLDISYTDAAGTLTKRRVWPLSIVFLDHMLMLLAYCTLRQGFRKFLLHRIETAQAAEAHFRPRRVPLLREFQAEMRANGRNRATNAAPHGE
jgi:predicted DNA-binding transcriptional regulator YafY